MRPDYKQANILGRTPVSFTDTLDTARFNAPVSQRDVFRLVLFKCTMFSITPLSVTGRALSDHTGSFSLVPKNELHTL